MQNVYVLIGAPACGKTRWSLRNAKSLGATVVSADVVRDAIRRSGGDPFDGDRVFAALDERLQQQLAAGDSVIADATHWRREFRAYAIRAARAVGAQAVGVWFDVPLEVCLQRNEGRLGSSPGLRREDPETIRRIHTGLEPPTLEEFEQVARITLDHDQFGSMNWPEDAQPRAAAQAEAIRDLIRRAGRAWVTGDADAFASLFADDGEFVVPGRRWQGRQAIRDALARFAQSHTGVQVEIRDILVQGDRAAVEWRWQDTDLQTGAVHTADDVIVVDFREGRIVGWREYIDAKTPASAP